MVKESVDGLQVITPASQPEYRKLVAPLASACWPEFMLHDPISDANWDALFERFPDYQFGLLDQRTGVAVAMGNSLTISWDKDLAQLPEEGWDWAFVKAVEDHRAGVVTNLQCAIQIAIHPRYRGQGLSARMVQAMRSIGQSKGYERLIAPVRPSQKADYPLADIDRYVRWKNANKLPFDAWLRVHERAGAKFVKVCHKSMTICGNVNDWQSWTGLSFPESGVYAVPGALNPIRMDLDADQGVYVEPNVWMVHDLR